MKRRKLTNGHSNGNGHNNIPPQQRRRPGRPGVYGPDKVRAAKEAANLGATDYQLAIMLGVDTPTIYLWQNTHPEFKEALSESKKIPNARVERSLYHRACGYTYEAEEIFCNKDGEVTRVEVTKHVPPDTTACIFWLKNRDSASWRENGNNNQEADVTIQDAQIQLLARVFGVATRLAARQTEGITARTIEAE